MRMILKPLWIVFGGWDYSPVNYLPWMLPHSAFTHNKLCSYMWSTVQLTLQCSCCTAEPCWKTLVWCSTQLTSLESGDDSAFSEAQHRNPSSSCLHCAQCRQCTQQSVTVPKMLNQYRYFFSSTKYFRYRYRIGTFRRQIFPIPVLILFFYIIFYRYWFQDVCSGSKFFRYWLRDFFPVPNFSDSTKKQKNSRYLEFPVPVRHTLVDSVQPQWKVCTVCSMRIAAQPHSIQALASACRLRWCLPQCIISNCDNS